MAKTSAIRDKFPQFLMGSAIQTSLDQLVFARIGVGVSIFDYAAFLINRIEYEVPSSSFKNLSASDDQLEVALTGSDQITSLSSSLAEVYDKVTFAIKVPTAVGFQIYPMPVVHDFTGMPGGGILIPAQDMYVAVDSDSLPAVCAVSIRAWYTVISLKAEDYIELAQRLRVLST